MARLIALTLVLPLFAGCRAEQRRAEISAVLAAQAAAWNAGDLEAFMAYYWRSPDLEFISSYPEKDPATGTLRTLTKTTRGWQATLDRYRRRYPTPEAMGTLTFSDLEIKTSNEDAARVEGRYRLVRRDDSPTGRFILDLRCIDGAWRIVRDRTVAD